MEAKEFEGIWKLTDVNWPLRSKYEFAEDYSEHQNKIVLERGNHWKDKYEQLIKSQKHANTGVEAWGEENKKLRAALEKIKEQHLKVWTIANNALSK